MLPACKCVNNYTNKKADEGDWFVRALKIIYYFINKYTNKKIVECYLLVSALKIIYYFINKYSKKKNKIVQ